MAATVFHFCLLVTCLWAMCLARPLRYMPQYMPQYYKSDPSRDTPPSGSYYYNTGEKNTPYDSYYNSDRNTQYDGYYNTERDALTNYRQKQWYPSKRANIEDSMNSYYVPYDTYDRDEDVSSDMELLDPDLTQLYTELVRLRQLEEAKAAMKYDISDDLMSEQRILDMLLEGQLLDQSGDVMSDDTVSDLDGGFGSMTDEGNIPGKPSRERFHQQLEISPIEFSDLNDLSREFKSKGTTDYADKQEDSKTGATDASQAVSGGMDLSKDKARQLLSALQKAEMKRAQQEATPDLPLQKDSDKDVLLGLMEPSNQDGEKVVEQEADMLKLKEILGEMSTQSKEEVESSVKGPSVERSSVEGLSLEGEIYEDDDSRDLEIDLLKKQINLVLQALKYSIDTEPADVRSVADMRELVNQAEAEQEAINYLESTRNRPLEPSMD